MKLIDLSHVICDHMPTYPGDEKTTLMSFKTFEKDSYHAFSLQTGLHIGTHIDMPMHLLQDNRTVDCFPLDSFCGNAVLLDIRGQKIVSYQKKYEQLIHKGDIVLLFTGHDKYFSKPSKYYSQHPTIDQSFAEFLISKKTKMVGMDLPSPDTAPFAIHKMLLQHDIFILENMTNLVSLTNTRKFELFAVPLKIQAEASLVRAYARINEE